jgi:hypothetical protein
MVGGGAAVALGALLAYFSPGVPLEEGPLLMLLVLLPVAAAALVEWRYDRKAQTEAAPTVGPPTGAANGE